MLAVDKFSMIRPGNLKIRQRLSRLPFHSIYLNVGLIAIEMRQCFRIHTSFVTQKLIKMVPVKDLRCMELTFMLPEQISHFKTKVIYFAFRTVQLPKRDGCSDLYRTAFSLLFPSIGS